MAKSRRSQTDFIIMIERAMLLFGFGFSVLQAFRVFSHEAGCLIGVVALRLGRARLSAKCASHN